LPPENVDVSSTASFLATTDDAQVTLQVHLGSKFLYYHVDDGKSVVNFEAAVIALDSSGKVAQSFSQTFKAALTTEEASKAFVNGYNFNRRLKLNPGLYQIRVGVRDINTGRIGTTMSFVDVPALSSNRIVLSSLFLGKQNQLDPSSGGPNFVVGAARFNRSEPIFYRFVAYKPTSLRADSDLVMKLEVFREEKTVYVTDWQPLMRRIVRQTETAIEIGGQLTVSDDPGSYCLRVFVQNQKTRQTASQASLLNIE
jgi:hypothetical protein